MLKKTSLIEITTKNNLPGLNYGSKKSDWLNYPLPLKSYWLKPQCEKTLLVEVLFKNNLQLPFGEPLCSFDPLQTYKQSSKQANKQFMFVRLFSARKRIIFQSKNSICICAALLKTLFLTSEAEKSIF